MEGWTCKFANLNVKFKCRLDIEDTFLAAENEKFANYWWGELAMVRVSEASCWLFAIGEQPGEASSSSFQGGDFLLRTQILLPITGIRSF